MKKIIVMMAFCSVSFIVKAQSNEVQQLLLNWEKLTQFKKILQNMYDGYKILHAGYTSVIDISKGNFNLHKFFLDGLMQVSPAVKKYKRIADIINYQVQIIKEYKGSFNKFKSDQQFTLQEIGYMKNVYKNIFDESVQALDELAMVVTAGKLRMSDDERLQAIDNIYDSIENQYSFLRDFNSNTALLSMQRKSEQVELKMSKRINGL